MIDVVPVVRYPPPTRVPLAHDALELPAKFAETLFVLPVTVVTDAVAGAPVRHTARATSSALELVLLRAVIVHPLPLLFEFRVTRKPGGAVTPPPVASVANGQVTVSVWVALGATLATAV